MLPRIEGTSSESLITTPESFLSLFFFESRQPFEEQMFPDVSCCKVGTHAAFCLLPATRQDMHATPFRVSCSGEEDVLKCENAQSHTHIQYNMTSSGNVASHRKHKNTHTGQNPENR